MRWVTLAGISFGDAAADEVDDRKQVLGADAKVASRASRCLKFCRNGFWNLKLRL